MCYLDSSMLQIFEYKKSKSEELDKQRQNGFRIENKSESDSYILPSQSNLNHTSDG